MKIPSLPLRREPGASGAGALDARLRGNGVPWLDTIAAWLLALLWILPLVYAVWTAFHAAEYATRFSLLTPLTLVPTGQTDATNKVPVGFPEMQGAFSTTYRNDLPLLGGDWFWYARAEANYTGRIYVDEINQSWIDDNVKVNARLGIEGEGRRLELYAQNIFNNKQWQSAVRGSGSNLRAGPRIVSEPTAFVVLPRLRTFGIRASFNF